jgi:hypothetical protein
VEKTKTTSQGIRAAPTDKGIERPETERSNTHLDTNNTTWLKVAEMISNTHNEVKSLKDIIGGQQNLIQELHTQLEGQLEESKAERARMMEEIRQLREQLDQIASSAVGTNLSPHPSYVEVARTPPTSQPSNVRTLSTGNTTPSTVTDTLYCTIDTSRVGEQYKGSTQVGNVRQAIEKEMRAKENRANWRCIAVVKDAKNTDRIKVICRDEAELGLIKEAAQKIVVPGARVLGDQLYPVRIDNANRIAILDTDGSILPGAAEALGKENEVNIAKIAWLSRRDSAKAYGSMVIYVTKGSDAKRLLEGKYFHLAGESAYTNTFEPRIGPIQCYNCQEIGHKAFSCKKPQICAKCAGIGHDHRTCQATVLKCVPCGGPHESFSKNCRMRRLHIDG